MMLVVLGPNNVPITIPLIPPAGGMLHGGGSSGQEWAKTGLPLKHYPPAHYLHGPPLNYAHPPSRVPKAQERVNRNALSRSLSEGGEEKKKSNNARYKTELCRPFQESGTCKYAEKCQFAHGEAELRNVPRHPKYKTEKCKTFHTTGFCPYGPRCHFIHNAEVENSFPPPQPRVPRRAPMPTQQLIPSHDLLFSLAQQRQRQLSIQAVGCLGSSGESPVPSTGSTSPSSFSSSDEGDFLPAFFSSPSEHRERRDPAVESLAAGLHGLFHPPTPKRLPVFSGITSAAA